MEKIRYKDDGVSRTVGLVCSLLVSPVLTVLIALIFRVIVNPKTWYNSRSVFSFTEIAIGALIAYIILMIIRIILIL